MLRKEPKVFYFHSLLHPAKSNGQQQAAIWGLIDSPCFDHIWDAPEIINGGSKKKHLPILVVTGFSVDGANVWFVMTTGVLVIGGVGVCPPPEPSQFIFIGNNVPDNEMEKSNLMKVIF